MTTRITTSSMLHRTAGASRVHGFGVARCRGGGALGAEATGGLQPGDRVGHHGAPRSTTGDHGGPQGETRCDQACAGGIHDQLPSKIARSLVVRIASKQETWSLNIVWATYLVSDMRIPWKLQHAGVDYCEVRRHWRVASTESFGWGQICHQHVKKVKNLSCKLDRHSLLKKLFAETICRHPFRFPWKDAQGIMLECGVLSLFTSPWLWPMEMFSTSKVPSSVSVNPLSCNKLRILCDKFVCIHVYNVI